MPRIRKVLSFNLFSRKLALNKKQFSRDRSRENELGRLLAHRASTGILSFGKLMVALFLTTPVVAVTSVFSESVILIVANILLSIAHVSNFVYRLFNKEVSVVEAFLTVIAIGFAITAIVYLMPSLFTVQMSLLAFMTCVNAVATAINTFFVVNRVLAPPLIRFIEQTVDYVFGYDLHRFYTEKRPLDERKDRHVIERLLGEKMLCSQNRPLFDTYQKLLNKLCWYKEKYQGQLFGTIFRQEKIATVDEAIRELTFEAKAGTAIQFIEKKISFKKTRGRQLREARNALNDAWKKNMTHEYNRLGQTFFTDFRTVNSKADLDASYKAVKDLFSQEMKQHAKRVDDLIACIPPKP